MELLVIKHEDFELIVESSQFAGTWAKAMGNLKREELVSQYNWSDGVLSVVRKDTDSTEWVLAKDENAPAVFFDNTDYPLWVEFNTSAKVKEAFYGSPQQKVNDNFSFHQHRQILSGFLNYGNEIGKSEIVIDYVLNSGEKKMFRFFFEVLSTKLNYHEHWRRILLDIEAEYRMLSLDFLKRTYHGFTVDDYKEAPDIIWWSIFKGEQEKFANACKAIIERPRHRLKGRESYLRADKIRRFTPNLENKFAEYGKDSTHLYRVEEQLLSNDTLENRFLKYTLIQISAKYNLLRKRIVNVTGPAVALIEEMKQQSAELTHLMKHPFFRTVGSFKGLSQESIVLQRATGYSQVYRTWILLRRSYSLNDGLYHLETKDIATLYEIWCFIEMRKIVKEQLGADVTDEQCNRMELNALFRYELGKGEASRVLFRKGNVELAELVYNLKSGEDENEMAGIEHWVSSTVPQKPDIVLQLTKDDLEKGMKYTYLFDAKYRISRKKEKGVDTPPADAINQMHRYRDAIYYRQKVNSELKKEVIGGYILFPGDGKPMQVQAANFYKSIAEVNIGAFPLRPGDNENRDLLEQFVGNLIRQDGISIVTSTIPQKGTVVEVHDRVLVGYVKDNKAKFENGLGEIYYTRSKFPTSIHLNNLHYFVPYIKGRGIRDVYEVVHIRTIAGSEVMKGSSDDLRLAFVLGKCTRLFEDYKMIKLPVQEAFNDTTFEFLSRLI